MVPFPAHRGNCQWSLSWPARLLAAVAVTVGASVGRADDQAVPGVREVAPELFYMENESGRLVPVPGFQYRDFIDLFRMKEGLAGPLQPPAAVLENVVMRIDASDVKPPPEADDERTTATCPVTVECSVRQSRGGWASAPLELGGLLLAAPPRHEGPGRMIVDVVPGGGGYRGWFDTSADAAADAMHTVVLEGRLAVDVTATHEAFALRLPAAVASLVEIRSARRKPAVTVQPAAADQRVVAAAEGGGSLITLAGLGGGGVNIRVADRREDRETRGVAAEVVTESTVRIDGRNAVTDAVIQLSNLPGDTSKVSITLPPRTTLRTVRAPASLLGRGGTADAPTIDVAADVAADGQAVVELSCERPIDPSGNTTFEAIGFAVAGIPEWRQWGRVSLVVDGDWQATWTDGTELRRVDPPANVRLSGFIAAFAYDAQPSMLPVRVRPRQSRVVIEPEYRYEVGSNRVTVDARFRVAARGTPVSSISIAIDPSWSIDEVGPASAVDVGGVATDAGETVIPFTQALSGDTVVEVRASRPVDKSADRVSWKLPVPRADLIGPAVVVIASQSDIELLPENEGINGLVRQTAAAVPLADADKTALVYRLDAVDGSFAAARRFLPRRVETSISAEAVIDGTEIVVDETIRLDVLHVPLEFIELVVPDAIASSGGFQMRQGDDLLDPTVVVSGGDDEEGLPATCMRAILPTPLLGSGEVRVRFTLPAPTVPPESTVAFDLPLALPRGTSIGRQSIAIAVPDMFSAGVRGDAWRRDVGPTLGSATQTWSSLKPQRELPLAISARRSDVARSMVVEAAWLQTRLLPGIREDVRAYVISAAEDRIVLSLPAASGPAADAGEDDGEFTTEVRLDGEFVTGAVRPAGRIVVDLPRVDPVRRWRLDIRTVAPREDGWPGIAVRAGLPVPVRLEPPLFEGPVLERRFYWTLHVRPDEHVLGLPRQWTSQQRWIPGAWGWRLEAATTPTQLAAWMAAAAGGKPAQRPLDEARSAGLASAPPLNENTFVFSGIGDPGAVSPWLVPEWFVVLLASGMSLACGLALVYRPAARRLPWVIAAAAGLGLAAAAAPGVAPLVGQAAVPGAVLAIAAWAIRLASEPRVRRASGWRLPIGQPASSLTRPNAASLIVAPTVDESPTATDARPR
ncbi:MAG: hypothetical protein K8S94_17080 [Planctomycetia bacterium]|nr:hypothetical protein [Planctomycetia bacterium]